MAMLHGRAGSVSFAGGGAEDLLRITSWTADATADVAETTAMSDANYWKSYLAGFKDWTATVEVNSNTASFLTSLGEATPAALVLTLVAGTTLTGNAFMTGASMSEPVDGIVTITYNFQGTGELAYA